MKKHVLFYLNHERCAIDIDDVLEIVPLHNMVKTKKEELNAMVWKNKSLPVVDPIKMISLKSHVPTTKSRILVVHRKGYDFGFLVDSVVGIAVFHPNDIEEPSLKEERYVCGVIDRNVKVFTPDVFVLTEIKKSFDLIKKIDLQSLEEPEMFFAAQQGGKEQLIDSARLRMLNMVVRATKNQIDEAFIQETLEIHDLLLPY